MEDSNKQEIDNTEDEEAIAVGDIKQSRVTLSSTGNRVTLTGGIYAHVNFYIRQSRKYFPQHRLRTFLYFYYMQWFYGALIFPGSLLGFHCSTALILCQIHMCFFLIYCQHLHVCLWTLQLVMQQETVPNHTMSVANDHIVIDVEEYNLRYAATSSRGISLATCNANKIELQVFRQSAMDQMRRTTRMTLAGLLAAFLMWLLFTIVGVALLV